MNYTDSLGKLSKLTSAAAIPAISARLLHAHGTESCLSDPGDLPVSIPHTHPPFQPSWFLPGLSAFSFKEFYSTILLSGKKIAFRASEGKMINSTINNVKFLEGKIPQSQQTNNQQGKGAVAYQ